MRSRARHGPRPTTASQAPATVEASHRGGQPPWRPATVRASHGPTHRARLPGTVTPLDPAAQIPAAATRQSEGPTPPTHRRKHRPSSNPGSQPRPTSARGAPTQPTPNQPHPSPRRTPSQPTPSSGSATPDPGSWSSATSAHWAPTQLTPNRVSTHAEPSPNRPPSQLTPRPVPYAAAAAWQDEGPAPPTHRRKHRPSSNPGSQPSQPQPAGLRLSSRQTPSQLTPSPVFSPRWAPPRAA